MNLDTVKNELTKKRETLWARLEKIKDDLCRKSGALSPDFSEQAVELENNEVLEELDASIHGLLEQIDTALERIEAGTYGTCIHCGNPIRGERLAALPETSNCIACASSLEEAASS